MNIFKLNPKAELPAYATAGSAAFDLRACIDMNERLNGYNPLNRSIEILPKVVGGKVSVQLHPQFRVLIPTGLIFDIPQGYEMKIHARSGLSLKQGLVLANGVAVIDSDYVDQTFVMLLNTSDALVVINDGDRVAQAQLQETHQTILEETLERPAQKTDRVGGLGSTGVA